jgi:hypothetical protein
MIGSSFLSPESIVSELLQQPASGGQALPYRGGSSISETVQLRFIWGWRFNSGLKSQPEPEINNKADSVFRKGVNVELGFDKKNVSTENSIFNGK